MRVKKTLILVLSSDQGYNISAGSGSQGKQADLKLAGEK